MNPATKTRETLNRFLVENFYTDTKKKKFFVKIEETQFEDFIVINIVPPHHSTFNIILLTLISIYKDLR